MWFPVKSGLVLCRPLLSPSDCCGIEMIPPTNNCVPICNLSGGPLCKVKALRANQTSREFPARLSHGSHLLHLAQARETDHPLIHEPSIARWSCEICFSCRCCYKGQWTCRPLVRPSKIKQYTRNGFKEDYLPVICSYPLAI